MSTWILAPQSPRGTPGSVGTGEAQFVRGIETAADVITVAGEGVSPRHAWEWLGKSSLQLEPLRARRS